MHDLFRILLVIAAPPAAGALAIGGLHLRAQRSPEAVPNRVRWGIAMGGAQCTVQLLLLIPLVEWLSDVAPSEGYLFTTGTALELPLVIIYALCLVGFLRLAAMGTTRLAIRRMRGLGQARATTLPGVQMRRMFGHIAEQRFFGFALVTGIVGGVYEELAYRGLLQAAASVRIGVFGGLLLASAVFALSHAFYGPTGVLFALLAGLILGASVAWLGELTPAIAAHAAYNGLTLVTAYRTTRAPRPIGEIPPA